ncbi:MAG: ArgE/DapE family deacylase [Candidatus Aminicenantales bacterium]
MRTGEGSSSWIQSRGEWARELLCRLIAFRSTTGAERDVQEYLLGVLTIAGFPAELAPVPEDVVRDVDYTIVPGHTSYQGRANILVNLPGSGGGRSAIINSHTDIVPGPDELFNARSKHGVVYGRGACDAKGQVLTILLALSALKGLGIRLKGDVQAQFVIEEEAGGNGSLSAIIQGHRADAAVVFEPTGLSVCPTNRGAVWYKLGVTGRSVHMGNYREGVSAVDEMLGLVSILKEYESFLRDESKGHPLFSDDPSPVVVNVGQIRGGDWPSTVPGECVVEGGIGFLPNRRIQRIQEELRALIESKATPWARAHYSFEFARLHNEAFETPIGHPAVTCFHRAAESVLGRQKLMGWGASCDGRLFFHRGQMPTIVFGPGDLGHAHSEDEQISLDDILRASEVLVKFLVDWCGIEERREEA